MPLIALFLCMAFVIFLIWLDHRQSPNVTWTLWVPTIWMLHTASKPLASYFQTSGAPLESSPLDRAFLLTLMAIAIGILIWRRFDSLGVLKENIWVTVLVVFMLISVLWSNIPGTSFIRWVRELLALLMAFVVRSEPFPRKAMLSLLRRTIYILIPFSLLLIKYFPYYGIQYGRWSGVQMWIGVTLQKNGLGRLCMISIFVLIWSLVRRRQGRNPRSWKYETHMELLILALAVALLRGPKGDSYSATAIGALAAGFFVYWGISLLRKLGKTVGPNTVTFIIAICIALGALTPFTGGAAVGSLAPSLGRDSTLTDRTAIWNELVPIAMKNPLIGGGLGSFWIPSTRVAFDLSESHCGYLDVVIGIGFVGLFLVSLFILSSSRRAQSLLSRDFDWGVLWISFLIMAVIHNITESSIDTLTSQLTAVLLFLAITSTKAEPEPEASLEKTEVAE